MKNWSSNNCWTSFKKKLAFSSTRLPLAMLMMRGIRLSWDLMMISAWWKIWLEISHMWRSMLMESSKRLSKSAQLKWRKIKLRIKLKRLNKTLLNRSNLRQKFRKSNLKLRHKWQKKLSNRKLGDFWRKKGLKKRQSKLNKGLKRRLLLKKNKGWRS